MSGKAFHTVFCGSPLIRASFLLPWINGLPQNTVWKAFFPRHNSSLISRKNQAKFENYCISRRWHRFIITQPNLMILVSLSSAENASSNAVKNLTFVARKVLNIPHSASFGTPSIQTRPELWTLNHAFPDFYTCM